MSDLTQKRRDAKNLGAKVGIDRSVPPLSAARTNVINIERLLVRLLRTEVDRFKADQDLLRQFFEHMFDPIVGADEREEFVKNFVAATPDVVLGYPRPSSRFPCIAVILQADSEDENFLGDFGGETEDDEDDRDLQAREYSAVLCDNSYGIYIFATHPDVCLYLYYWTKMVIFGAKLMFLTSGLTDVTVTGGEVSPDEQYLPERMFERVLTVTGKSMFTVPQFALQDRRRLQVLGLFRDDVVVDGVPGGIHAERLDGTENDTEGNDGDPDDGE